MKKLIVLVMIFLCGCATIEIAGACRHQAIYAAAVFSEEYPVRIMTGPRVRTKTDPPPVRIMIDPVLIDKIPWHAQAQAKIKGEWKWLSVYCNCVYVSKQDRFIPIRSYSLKEYCFKRIFKKL